MARLKRRRIRRHVSQGFSLLAALGLLIGVVQIPSSPPAAGGAFPCQGHPCGCDSALACWLGCCCFTPGQRLAWAKENEVQPPEAFLERYDLDKGRLVLASGESNSDPGCCQHDSQTETSVPLAASDRESACCAGSESTAGCRSSGASDSPKAPDDDQDRSEHPVLLAGHCQGLGHWWIAGGQTLGLPLPRVAWHRGDREIAVTILDAACDSHSDRPSVPPG